MQDLEIREALHERLRRRHSGDPNTRVVDEMAVLRGECRIDVAVINGRLEGFEIKSARDSLDRLPRQAAAYGRVFDRLTMVCAERHLCNVLATLPEWWGVEVAQEGEEAVRIVQERPAKVNREVESRAIAQLLWRGEALAALEELGLARGLRSKPRKVLWAELAEALPPNKLRAVARDRLRARRSWLAAE